MATIKSYTDLQQSKKLAEILPLESADMLWEQHGAEPYVTIKPWTTIGKSIGCHCLSCWSLAALLGVIPEGIIENYYTPNIQKENGKYSIAYGDEELLCEADNPVDACVEMILKLNELNLL